MTERAEKAVSLFDEGFSCSQAVLAAFADLFGLGYNHALKIAQPFGGGIAHRGEMCGAVSGAFMAIGLKYGRIRAEDIEAREKTYEKVQQFINLFLNSHETLLCRGLLGVDLSQPGVYEKANEDKIFSTICPKIIQSATEFLEEIL